MIFFSISVCMLNTTPKIILEVFVVSLFFFKHVGCQYELLSYKTWIYFTLLQWCLIKNANSHASLKADYFLPSANLTRCAFIALHVHHSSLNKPSVDTEVELLLKLSRVIKFMSDLSSDSLLGVGAAGILRRSFWLSEIHYKNIYTYISSTVRPSFFSCLLKITDHIWKYTYLLLMHSDSIYSKILSLYHAERLRDIYISIWNKITLCSDPL